MLKKGIFVLVAAGMSLTACIEHEVIPAPVPEVELYAHFIGDIGGQLGREFTENVDYYVGSAGVNYEDNFGIATTKYYFNLTSTQETEGIGVMLGSISWNIASGASAPSLSSFNQFFLDNDVPPYMDNADNGFQVLYTDVNGQLWTSRQTSTNLQEVVFTDIVQESDDNGDYSKFTCDFNCWVYADLYDQVNQVYYLDSIHIQNATLKGWFQR